MIIIKEIAESFVRNLRRFLNRSKDTEVVNSLNSEGIFIAPNFLSKEKCKILCEQIDELILSGNANVWHDDECADHRIYFVNEINLEMREFYENASIRKVLLDYTGTAEPKGMLLAAKIEFKDGNKGSGGGWHRDSPVSHQFKAICYLNDVTEFNGPFQYISKSHRKENVFRSYIRGIFKFGQYRFDPSEIQNYLTDTNSSILSVVGDAGTIVYADTKGIHRGKPLDSGVRYVLFCYFWHSEIPAHFITLKQSAV